MNQNTLKENQQLLGKLIFDLGIADAFQLNADAPLTRENKHLKEFVGFLLNAGDDHTFMPSHRFQLREIGEDAVQDITL